MSIWTPDGEVPVPPSDQADTPPLSDEQREQAEAMAKELSEARARLLETDVSTVLANHAMGIYELAAIHLTADEPRFDQAQAAIDGLAGLMGGLEGRLGEAEATLDEALHQLRLAFVERKRQASEATPADD